MPATVITGSANISSLDTKIVGDLCVGKFFIDVTPSVFLGSGANNVLGAKVRITNSGGVVIKDFSSSYDIVPPMTGIFENDIPLLGNAFDWDTYTVDVQLTDAGGKQSIVSKTIEICPANPKNLTKKQGELKASITGNCQTGKVTVLIDQAPTYKTKPVLSKTQTYTLKFPGGALAPLTSTSAQFSVQAFEGEYLLTGTVCALYDFTDNVFVKVQYLLKCSKKVICAIDECCIFDKLAEIHMQLNSGCSKETAEELSNTSLEALLLLKTIKLGIACGSDVAEYVDRVESLLKCKCSCNSTSSTPLINNSPARDFIITGCNISSSTTGLTTTWDIENYSYEITVDPNLNFITATTPTLVGCIKKQQINFNVALLYGQIKNLINNSTEYNFWAGVINNTLNSMPAGVLACLGFTDNQWNLKTFRDKIIAIIEKICTCCGSSNCNAVITADFTTTQGANTLIQWSNNSSVKFVAIYIDGVYRSEVMAPVSQYLVLGTNDGLNHTYALVAKCDTGLIGNTILGKYNNAPSNVCPTPGTLVFGGNSTCTEPLNVSVVGVSGGNSVRFDDAAVAPPAHSYIVSRSIHGIGSYSVVGAPTFNAGLGKYEIIDTTANPNILYDYKVESQCADGSRPNAIAQYANITCPNQTITAYPTDLTTEFVNSGGAIDKYQIRLFDVTGTTQIGATIEVLPAFTTPISRTFPGLVDATQYKIELTVFIGTYSKKCPQQAATTASYPFTCGSIETQSSGIAVSNSALSRIDNRHVRVVVTLSVDAGSYVNREIVQANPLYSKCCPYCDISINPGGLTGVFTFTSIGHLLFTGDVATDYSGTITLNFDENSCF